VTVATVSEANTAPRRLLHVGVVGGVWGTPNKISELASVTKAQVKQNTFPHQRNVICFDLWYILLTS